MLAAGGKPGGTPALSHVVNGRRIRKGPVSGPHTEPATLLPTPQAFAPPLPPLLPPPPWLALLHLPTAELGHPQITFLRACLVPSFGPARAGSQKPEQTQSLQGRERRPEEGKQAGGGEVEEGEARPGLAIQGCRQESWDPGRGAFWGSGARGEPAASPGRGQVWAVSVRDLEPGDRSEAAVREDAAAVRWSFRERSAANGAWRQGGCSSRSHACEPRAGCWGLGRDLRAPSRTLPPVQPPDALPAPRGGVIGP